MGSGGELATFFSVFQSGIVTSEGDIISGNIKHIIQRCHDERFEEPLPLTVDPNKYPIYDEVFSMAVMWGAAFYHSNIDALGRLIPYIPFLRKHPTIKIHTTWVWPKFAAKFLSGEGLTPDRFVHGIVRGKLVYVPASFLCHRPSFFPTHLLGLYMKATLPNDPSTRNTIIVIRRTPQVKPHLRPRHFLNHDHIMMALKRLTERLKLTLWEFQDDPVPDIYMTAQMFNRALIVIAPHGAGEVNLVFSQPGTVLIEGMCIREFKAFSMAFRNLIHLQGGIYHGLYNAKQQCEDITAQEVIEPTILFLRSFGYFLP
ncbi:hypothetical protein CAPTEDRAFT_191030 [Capitella teleta]|uniref:Glycosyltransferase 61 catalytic domain-containing protein n=1 Tax=Capitella teleta TaxID=283909 RepID=R7V402_CAPTE|nr:hypothetical protein CAPTEDRAFT_191030 [Capitella teleta]|eukprot:ELU11086.1 hypothetical protein CAPTEDRAFT_191030 [Capitella teleta]